MNTTDKVMSWLEGLAEPDWRECYSDSEVQETARKALDLIDELLKEQEEQIKNRDESLEKAREEIKWLRGMMKEQEAVVRCKDCKNVCFCDTTEIIPYIPVFAKCTLTDEAHDPDWFCADGERKVGEA